MIISVFKQRSSTVIVLPCYAPVFVVALHSFLLTMKPEPPTTQFRFRIAFITLLAGFPWIALVFLK
jgi:hypothetical protein